MNSSGKVLTIFLVIIAILLISLTAISLFFFQKETDRRKLAETTLEEFRQERAKLEESLKEIKKQNFLLEEKNKEADERIEDLSDELELEKGLRETMKSETEKLKKEVEEAKTYKSRFSAEMKKKEDAQAKLAEQLADSEKKIRELEAKLSEEVSRGQELNRLYEKQKSEITRLETAKIPPSIEENTLQERTANDMPEDLSGLGIELDEIVVSAGENVYPETEMLFGRPDSSPDRALEGRILSVDAETEFVIVSLGQTNGIKAGDVLAIYREGKYLGDIRVTRLQPEMSAADLIPPFSIRNVKKNDQVRIK